MNRINVMIVDDEQNCIDTLSILLTEHHEQVSVIATARNVKDALSKLDQNKDKIDILFLDVQMPGGNGFSLLEQLPDPNFHVIFTTAYDQHALQAIKYSAVDYLLKPIDNEELKMAIKKSRALSVKKQDYAYLQEFKAALTQPQLDRIAVANQTEIQIIPLQHINYLQSDNNYTTFYTTTKKQVISSKSIGHYENLLEPNGFMRVHNSYLINMSKVVRYHKGKTGILELDSGIKIEISSRRREEVIQRLGLA